MATHTRRRPIEWSDQTLELAIHGAFRVYHGGQPIPYTLTPQERQVFEQAKQRGYVLFSKRPNLLNAFRQWCAIHRRPIVYAQRSGRYATIKMDILGEEEGCLLGEIAQEKIRAVHDRVGSPHTLVATTPVYNYISGVDPACAELVAQAFVAIYCQNSGLQSLVPAFPPAPGAGQALVSRMEEAKRRHYVVTHTVRDALLYRWRDYCRAYSWPSVVVHEARRGHASVEVDLPRDLALSPALRCAITRSGQESGIWGAGRVSQKSAPWYYLGESGLRTITPVSTGVALRFAESIAGELAAAGYFPPIDEAWHE